MANPVVTVTRKEPVGERNLYCGTVALGNPYTTGGNLFDVAGNERFDMVMASGSGYHGTFVPATQLLKIYQGDNDNAADAPGIEVPNATDLSAVVLNWIGIGQ